MIAHWHDLRDFEPIKVTRTPEDFKKARNFTTRLMLALLHTSVNVAIHFWAARNSEPVRNNTRKFLTIGAVPYWWCRDLNC